MWTNIKDNFDALYPGHIICTSSTRPTVGLAEGHMIWETDTNKLLVYDGAVWKDVFPVAAPVGTVTQYAGAAAPTGYLLCDGAAVSRSTYADLFTLLSTTYGAGDGSTTFNLPDLRGRSPVGRGANATVSTLGNNDGVAEASRKGLVVPAHHHGMGTGADLNITSSGSHTHTATDSGHGHTATDSGHNHADNTSFSENWNLGGGGSVPINRGVTTATTGIGTANITVSSGTANITVSSASHTHAAVNFAGRIGLVTGGVDGNVAQNLGYLVINHIIKT